MLFITKNFPPEIGGGIRRIEAIYNLISDNKDIELEVVTANREASNNYKNVAYIKQIFFKDRCKNEVSNFKIEKSKIKLLDKAFLGWLPNVLRFIIFKKYDLIFTTVPSFTNLIIGFLYKKLFHKKTKLIADYRDFFSFNPSFEENIKKRIFRFIEKKILKICDYIIVTTKAMENILSEFIAKNNIFLIRNYICNNDKKIADSLKKISMNKSYYNLGYIGKLNTGRDPGKILYLLNSKIDKKDIAIYFIGVNEYEKKLIRESCNKIDLDPDRLFLLNTVDRIRSLQYMKSFDGLLLIVNNIALIKDGYGIPGKLYDYLAVNNNIFSDKESFFNINSEFICNKKNEFDNFINFSIKDNETLDNVFKNVLDKIIF